MKIKTVVLLLLVSGLGDPHINTVDGGRYTCHIQGRFIFARTNSAANTLANTNQANNVSDSELLYPSDIFTIIVTSNALSPVLNYVEQERGFGSVFTSYQIESMNRTFIIRNNNGRFCKYPLLRI